MRLFSYLFLSLQCENIPAILIGKPGVLLLPECETPVCRSNPENTD